MPLANVPIGASESPSQANSCSSRKSSWKAFIFLNVCAEDQADTIKSGAYHKIDKEKLFRVTRPSFSTSCLERSILSDIKSAF